MKRFAMAFVVVLFLAGCATTSFIPHGAVSQAPKPNSYFMPIISIHGPQPIDKSYVILGNVEASKDAITIFDKVKLTDVTEMVKQSARESGADALINVRVSHGRSTGRRVDSVRITAVAIVFKNPEEAFKQLKEMGAVFK